MAVNGSVSTTSFSATNKYVAKLNINELQSALNRLDTLKNNVQNCDCAPSNCCQSCQVCQNATCQSQSCQSQSCQSSANCNCCGDE